MAAIGDIARITTNAVKGGKKTANVASQVPRQQVVANEFRKQELLAARQSRRQAGFDSRKDEIRQRMAAKQQRGPSNFQNYAEKEKRIDFYSKEMSTKNNLKLDRLERQANVRGNHKSEFRRHSLREDAIAGLADRKERMQKLVPGKDGKHYSGDNYTLDGKGSFMGDADWDRLATSRKQRDASALGKAQRELSPQRKARRAAVNNRATRKAETGRDLAGVQTGGFMSASLETGSKLLRSGRSYFSEEGNIKKAAIRTAQTSAVSAVGHGGLAAIQGEDPWEAAKTGAVRGAFVGAGYQGLKGATGVNTGSIKGNLKGMYGTTRDTYKLHTAAGNANARANPDSVSHLVRKVMSHKAEASGTKNKFGLGGL